MSENKTDGVDVRPILEALSRRGGGKLADPHIGLFESVRQNFLWTGIPHDVQLLTLKRNAMLITGSKVVIGIDIEKKAVTYSHGVAPRGQERSLESIQVMMEALVLQVLGPGWTVKRGIIPEHDTIVDNDTRPASKSRKPTKRTRKGRSKKARNRK